MAVKIPCSYCKKKIDASASRCPYCQGEYSPEQVVVRTKTAKNGLAVGCLLLIGLVLLVGMCSSSEDAPQVPDKPGSGAKADAIQLYKSLMEIVEPCDRSANGVAVMMKSGDPIGIYRSAENASSACLETPTKIRNLKPPVSVGAEHYKYLISTLKNCENAYLAKWNGLQSISKALDGDQKVSVLAGIQKDAEDSRVGAMMCVGGLVSVAMKLGAKPEELPGHNETAD